MTRIALIAVATQLDYMPGGVLDFDNNKNIADRLLENDFDICIAARRIFERDNPSYHRGSRQAFCIKGTKGARLDHKIESCADYITTSNGLSAFEGGTLRPLHSLEEILKKEEITNVIVGGYYFEEAVAQTAFDANALGYITEIDESASQHWPERTHLIGVTEKLHHAGIIIRK